MSDHRGLRRPQAAECGAGEGAPIPERQPARPSGQSQDGRGGRFERRAVDGPLVRTSLRHAPTDANAGEVRARRRAFESRLWQDHQGLVLRLDDPDITGTHRLMIQALAKARGFA